MQHNKVEYPLVLRLFGPFDGRLHGKPLPRLRTRKGQWLLALLAMRHDREVDRDWLAGMLWPESPARQALYNLRRSLSDLRQALGPEGERLVSPTTRTICLSLAGTHVDVLAFDAAIARGDASSLEEAVSLYRGPLLEGCTEAWVAAEREAREQAYLAALETLAHQAMQRQDTAAATRYLRLVIATDPLRESAQRVLLEALAASGDMAAATLAFREYRLHLHRTLNAEPAAETIALFQQIRRQAQTGFHKEIPSAANRAAPSVSDRLPLPLTRFVGREQELTEIARLLSSTRLVTLMGPGGVGKTRLAIQLARQQAGHYQDGTWFVDLSGLIDATHVPQAIASALGVQEEKKRLPLEGLADHLGDKQMLLVLDNFEHLVDRGGILVRRLLEQAPGLTCLATSRLRLGIEGEHEFPVKSLLTPSLPGTPERLLEFESVQLFVERSQAVRPEFQLTDDNALDVASLCERLEGIPLAIELAASRISVLTPAQILAHLDRRLDFLVSRRRDIADRHRTLRAAIEGSYRLLPVPLQRFFARLSVFRGGWTLDAAEEVCEEPLALDFLEALREASLVVAEVETNSTGIRYRMLETLREYAEEKLKPENHVRLKERHSDYFLALAETGEKALYGAEQACWLQRLEQEHDNLRAALRHCLEDCKDAIIGLQMVVGLAQFWRLRGHWSEGQSWFERALAQAGAQERTWWRAKALYAAAALDCAQGNYETAQARYHQALVIAREIGDLPCAANSLINLGWVAHSRGDWKSAEDLISEGLQIHRKLENKSGIASALATLGWMLGQRGEAEKAQCALEEALTINRDLGSRSKEADLLTDLGNLAGAQGRLKEAMSLHQQSLAISRSLEDKWSIANSLGNLGLIANDLQDQAAARAYFEQSLSLQRELGERLGIAITLVNLGALFCDQEDYATARDCLVECLTLCQQLGAKRVAAYALEAFARVAKAQGQAGVSVNLWAAAHALREAIACPLPPKNQQKVDRKVKTLRAILGKEAFTVAWNAGLVMTFEQAVSTAQIVIAETAQTSETTLRRYQP